MKALVCGGTGCIGNLMVHRLAAQGHKMVVLGDLSPQHAQAL
ncbi:NAD-dependent epimerase/dehydratase family protein [Stenotrophomonas sp. Leaf70]|nr:NAD-dependent epimerase/dehydratase family protein [Stenotrophomonas sp. Leaf70]